MTTVSDILGSEVVRMLRQTKPSNPDLLWEYIYHFYNLNIPKKSVCPDHCAPFDYVAHSFFDGSDCLVWANRGGGKTENGAVLTHLDAVFRDGCSIRILGGSLDQSLKMYRYLKNKWDGGFADYLERPPMRRETRLLNGSSIQVLTQSTKSVRGPHVHKIRCDEIDEFNPEVWEAVQFVTTSSGKIQTSFEGMSTMHKPFGLFHEAVESGAYEVFKYCVWETIEKCKDWSCSRCNLYPVCKGIAKKSDGYIPIGDLIKIFNRASHESWEAEMEGRRPSFRGRVFKGYIDEPVEEGGHLCEDFPSIPTQLELWLTIDWGTECPFACLMMGYDKEKDRHYIIDEVYAARRTLPTLVRKVKELGPLSTWNRIIADPKGKRERIEFKRMGIKTRKAKVNITGGIELVRRHLKRSTADGKPKLLVAKRCVNTRKEFMKYAYKPKGKDGGPDEVPKDVDNHAMDALRNYFLTRERSKMGVKVI